MRLLLPCLLVGSALVALGCADGDVEPVDPPGAIEPTTELVYDGTVYKPVRFVLRSDVPDDDFEQIGSADEFSIPYEGDVPVYAREDYGDEVYTPDLTLDPKGSVGLAWVGWLPHDQVEDAEQQ